MIIKITEKEKERLRKLLLDDNKSYEEVGKLYNMTGGGIKKAAKRFGIELPQRRAINEFESFNEGTAYKVVCEYCGKEFIGVPVRNSKYCSQKCMGKAKEKATIQRWKENPETGTSCFTCSSAVRKYMLRKANFKCERCGWGEENPYTHKVPLQIHHIDGNSLNNIEDNLQVLCPNCHALTENFGGRNKNAPNGKSKYYKRK